MWGKAVCSFMGEGGLELGGLTGKWWRGVEPVYPLGAAGWW